MRTLTRVRPRINKDLILVPAPDSTPGKGSLSPERTFPRRHRVRPGQEEEFRWQGPRARALWPPWDKGHTKVLESVNHGLLPSALRPPCPSPIQLAVQVRQVPVPPEARGPPPLGGCQGDGAVYQLVAARHKEADGAELRGERGPLWVPSNRGPGLLSCLSPGAEATWLEPQPAAAKGSPGRGVYKTAPGLRSKEKRESLSCAEVRRCREGASHGSEPFTRDCIHVSALSVISQHSSLKRLKLCFLACQTAEIIEASPQPPRPPFYPGINPGSLRKASLSWWLVVSHILISGLG